MARKAVIRYTAKVDQSGRVVIPAEIREKAQLRAGATLTVTAGPSGRIVLEPTLAVLREAQEYFLSLGPPDELWSDEVLAERRLDSPRC
jgi:AbrB family looped-hinge helix DNA binding protein